MSTTPTVSETEDALARAMQTSVPLVSRPWAALGKPLGLSEDEVCAIAAKWLKSGLLREVSAVLEGSALGNDSALVAGRVPKDRLFKVAKVINSHPMVTHNYERNHDFNLWFTISVPPHMSLEHHLDLLAKEAGIEEGFFPMRRTHTFKIGVNFSLNDLKNRTSRVEVRDIPDFRPTEDQKAILRALQTPLQPVPQPFALLAEDAGVDEETLLAFANEMNGTVIRRYVATLRHRKVGVRGNGMAVWPVADDDDIDAIGWRMADHPMVSHCYARNPIEGFPYVMYSMVHGPDQDAVRAAVDTIRDELGLDEPKVLFSTTEFKKCRLRYYLRALDEWVAAREKM